MKRTGYLLLALLLLCVPALAAGSVQGETARRTEELLLPDGASSGVQWTKLTLSGHYGEKTVNVAEFDLSDPHLSVEVVNSGAAMVDTAPTAKACAAYTEAHPGQTVLAAVNGDLWMTSVHSGAAVTRAVLKTTRGALIVDGEIWATQQTDAENREATNAERGLPAGEMAAFGVTDANQPLVGSPDIGITVSFGGQTLSADGLNRLPCMDALTVYNARLGNTNYALNDSYEVEIETDGPAAFTAGGTLTGTVRAVYPAGSEVRPALDRESVVVLTARGKRISELENALASGDRVTFAVTLRDRWGHTELWQHVREAIGGHIPVLLDGRMAALNSDPSEYPVSFIGLRTDGRVMLCNVTSVKEKTYAGLRFSQALEFCRELGYSSVFYLDGGGSSTFVTLEDGAYTVRNNCSDGAPRSVVNSVGVVWNETPVCAAQGSLDYLRVPDAVPEDPTHWDGAQLYARTGAPHAVTVSRDAEENALVLTTDSYTNDAYATVSFAGLEAVQAEDYPYLTFRVRQDSGHAVRLKLYYTAGSVTAATEACTSTVSVGAEDGWQTVTADLTGANGWSGTLHSIRLDPFDGEQTGAGVSMHVAEMTLLRTAAEAEAASGPPQSAEEAPVPPPEPEPEPESEPETAPAPVRVESEAKSAWYFYAIAAAAAALLASIITAFIATRRGRRE